MGLLVAVVGISLILVLLLELVNARLTPTIVAFAEAKGRGAATEAMNRAVSSKIAQSIRYEDLMAIKTDNRGKVALVQPNTGEINRLASATVMEVQKSLRQLKGQEFDIPVGQLLGMPAFASRGPRLRVSVIPVGSVTASVTDDFEQAGINQTRHRIYLVVRTVVRIVVPLVRSTVEVTSRIPITEAVIMGEVPQVYFGGSSKGQTPGNISSR